MRYDEFIFIRSDIATLEQMLSRMPEENVIERMGLESRLKKMQAKLEGITPPAPPMLCYARVPRQPGQEEPGIMPVTILAIIGAAGQVTGGRIRVRTVQDNLITLESLTPEAHQRMEAAVQDLSAAGAGDDGGQKPQDPTGDAPAAAAKLLREMTEQAGVSWGHDRVKQERSNTG